MKTLDVSTTEHIKDIIITTIKAANAGKSYYAQADPAKCLDFALDIIKCFLREENK